MSDAGSNARLGHRGRRDDPLSGIHRLPTTTTPAVLARLLAGLDAGNTTDEQLARTWVAAQDLRLIFSCPDRARRAELVSVAGLLRRRPHPRTHPAGPHHRLLAPRVAGLLRTDGASNGPTEAINLLIKKIKLVGPPAAALGLSRDQLSSTVTSCNSALVTSPFVSMGRSTV
jgi:hypothetical protein